MMVRAVWLATSAPIFGYESLALTISDLVSAAALVVLAWHAFEGRTWAGWSISAVGVWLLFAPLVFSASTAAAMATDLLPGALVIGPGILAHPGTALEGPGLRAGGREGGRVGK